MARTTLERDVEALESRLGPLPEPVARPYLVVVSGLPGVGKTYFARALAQRLPATVLESDRLRKQLVRQPTHSQEESARLFAAAHALLERLLQRGVPVIFDATNLVERHREYLYAIAERAGARVVLVMLDAPAGVIKERLSRRIEAPDPEEHSSADWAVYQRMKPTLEPSRRAFYRVDTSKDITPALDKVEREVRKWLDG